MTAKILLVGFALAVLGCGDVSDPEEPQPALRAPNASVVAGAGVVKGAGLTMVVQVGQPFAQRAARSAGVSAEPLGPVNQ